MPLKQFKLENLFFQNSSIMKLSSSVVTGLLNHLICTWLQLCLSNLWVTSFSSQCSQFLSFLFSVSLAVVVWKPTVLKEQNALLITSSPSLSSLISTLFRKYYDYITAFTEFLLLSFIQDRWILKITDLTLLPLNEPSNVVSFPFKIVSPVSQIWCYNFIFIQLQKFLKFLLRFSIWPMITEMLIDFAVVCSFLNVYSDEMLVISFVNFLSRLWNLKKKTDDYKFFICSRYSFGQVHDMQIFF